MDKIFNDPEFPVYYNKIVAEEVSPLSGKKLAAVVADIPRDKETLDLLKQFAGPGPLPKR